jgi:hypothetical protein
MRAPSKLQLIWRSCAATLLLCAGGVLHAQAADTAGDPPDRVARLSYLEGDVGLLPSGGQDWGEAGINRPLTGGDRLSSAAGARAELELGGAALRLDGQTDVGVLQLDDRMAQLELTQGTLALTVRRLDDGQSYEIDTPTVALVVDHPGSFRVDVDRNGQGTRVTAFDGSATVYGENDAQRPVIAGRSYRFADSSLNDVSLEDIAGGDDFDAWSSARDRRYAASGSRRYVSEDVIGYQDLDSYGQWRSDPDYGTVWYPADVGADWAPYRDGHWAWVAPWGWTWVDDAPWGFAPYHYGRWAWRNGWCWVPGPIGWRPVYAPALVAFVGGRNWSLSIGSAPVGWFPLGPGDVYDPWYRSSRRYYTQVNVTNIYVRNVNRTVIVNRIDSRYRDWNRGIAPPVRAMVRDGHGPRGFTAMPARNFADADRVQRHQLKMDPGQLAGASVLTRAATPRPTPRSFAPQRPPQARPLPAQGFRREVVARHAPRVDMAADDRLVRSRPQAPGNVRVLQPHAATLPAVARIVPADRAPPPQAPAGDAARFAGGRDIRSADAAAGRPLREESLRPGELRSARFARPDGYAPREQAQRQGSVSFISSAASDRERAARAAPALPQAPRFERAEARPEPVRPMGGDAPRFQQAPSADAQARAARIETVRREQAMPPRGEAAQPARMRAPDFEAQLRDRAPPQPQPQPQRFERAPDFRAMRPMSQSQPVQRAAPPPAQAPQPHPPADHPRREAQRRFDEQH